MKFRLYTIDEIPSWCAMPSNEHFDGIGGCWGISSEKVKVEGEKYCAICEYYIKSQKPEN